MRNKTVNPDLYEQYMRTHCVDAVHYCADGELPNDTASSSCTVAPTPADTPQRAAKSKMSPVKIRLASSASTRTPSSDHFEGMQRQSLIEVSPETMKLFAPCSPEAETPKQVHTRPPDEDDPSEYVVHAPADEESEQTKLFGTARYL
jgi:hypothetical protein